MSSASRRARSPRAGPRTRAARGLENLLVIAYGEEAQSRGLQGVDPGAGAVDQDHDHVVVDEWRSAGKSSTNSRPGVGARGRPASIVTRGRRRRCGLAMPPPRLPRSSSGPSNQIAEGPPAVLHGGDRRRSSARSGPSPRRRSRRARCRALGGRTGSIRARDQVVVAGDLRGSARSTRAAARSRNLSRGRVVRGWRRPAPRALTEPRQWLGSTPSSAS